MNPYTIKIDDTRVTYWDSEVADAPTIVCIHGYRGTHHGLDRLARELPGYRLIIPDLPGFGESDAFAGMPHSVDSYVHFTEALISELKLSEPPVLLGHSFGSIVASHFAAKNPSAISKLVLVNPIGAPALEGPRGILTQLARIYYWVGKVLPERLGRKWLSWTPVTDIMTHTMTKSRDPAMKAYVKDQHRRYFSRFVTARVASEAFDASVSNDVRTVAPNITLKTLLIAGEKDDITDLDTVHALDDLFIDSQLVVLRDVGHLIHYEKAAEAAAAIRNFIS